MVVRLCWREGGRPPDYNGGWKGGEGIKPMILNRKRPLSLYGVLQVDR